MQFGLGNTHAVGHNMTGKHTLKTQILANEYAYGFKAPSALTVVGFRIWTKTVSTSVPATVNCGLYLEDSAATTKPAPLNTQVVGGKVDVGVTENWCTCIFTKKQVIKKDAHFWVSAWTIAVLPSSTTTGSAPAIRTFWRRGILLFNPTGIVTGPRIALILENGAPVLSAIGLPKHGNTKFAIEISNAGGPANLATIILGVSNTKTVGGLALPFDLGIAGFPGATLYVSDDFYVGPLLTKSTGIALLPLPIPSNAKLNGVKFYAQSYILGLKTKKLKFTNAGAGVVGK